MIKVGKKNEFVNNKNYKIIIGTSNSEINETLYFTIGSWGEVLLDKNDYNRVIIEFNKKIKKYIYFNINKDIFKADRTIVDLNMRSSGVLLNKKYYMNCEVTLFKKITNKYYDDDVNDNIKTLINNLINEVFEKMEVFKFHKTKK